MICNKDWVAVGIYYHTRIGKHCVCFAVQNIKIIRTFIKHVDVAVLDRAAVVACKAAQILFTGQRQIDDVAISDRRAVVESNKSARDESTFNSDSVNIEPLDDRVVASRIGEQTNIWIR